VYLMMNLPRLAWERFGWWLLIGLVLYFAYGYRNSRLGKTHNSATQQLNN